MGKRGEEEGEERRRLTAIYSFEFLVKTVVDFFLCGFMGVKYRRWPSETNR